MSASHQPEPDRLEAATDQAIAACGGDARQAVTALIVANEFLSNIARFGEEVERSRGLQKRLAYARSWYAYQDQEGQWRFGPSKFVGYDRMTAEGYIETAEDRDGRRTEAQLQQWFTAVDPESELGTQLSSALYGFLASYGKAPSTKMRINVPNDVHEKHFGATASDPHDILVATLIAAAKTLPPSHLEKLRANLFGRG
jgi:uncharacterized phage-associated protein